MNVWKPIAIFATVGLVASVGIQVASANKNPDPASGLQGPCFNQPHMAAAKGAIENALSELNQAEHNKNGWRDRAIAAENNAHNEINNGCNFANGK